MSKATRSSVVGERARSLFRDAPPDSATPVRLASEEAGDRAFAVLGWGLFALSFLKGFRLPSLWCATHFTFNYSQGFVRRGLVGELARRIGGDDVYKYDVFTAFSFFVMSALIVLFALAARRALRARSRDWILRVSLLVLAASPGMVFLVHAVGYFDLIGLSALLAFLLWAGRTRRDLAIFYVLLPLGLALALVHEGLIVMFGPSAMFIALCHFLRSWDRRPMAKLRVGLACAHLVVSASLVAALLIALSGTISEDRVHRLYVFAVHHADFAVRADAFEVFNTSARYNILTKIPAFWRIPSERAIALSGQIGFLPGFLFLVFCGARQIWSARRPWPARAALLLVFMAAALSPELMNFIGWDWPRWNSMALMTCAICTVAYRSYFPAAAQPRPSLAVLTTGLLLAAVGLTSTTRLFDDYQVQFFPFDRQFELIERVLERASPFGPRS